MQSLESFFEARPAIVLPSLILLDVRGTTLEPYVDVSAHPYLLSMFSEYLHRGTNLAFVTGCSSHTVDDLILRPWLRVKRSFSEFYSKQQTGQAFAYTETGSKGYRIDAELLLEPLPDFANVKFEPSVAASIINVLEQVNVANRFGANIESRDAQFNFYVDADRPQRQAIAKKIGAALQQTDIRDVRVHVPSSKTVVDISLFSKARAVRDLVGRLNLSDGQSVLVISDSLQQDGADIEMLHLLPQSKSVHVGALDAQLHHTTMHIHGGPRATQRVLSYALSLT